MDVMFSGVQPTGNLHIGNYLGAISLWVRNQHRYRNFFCIVDLHALTIPENIDRERCGKTVSMLRRSTLPAESTPNSQ